MNINVGKRLFVLAAILGAVAVFAIGFFVALGVRSVVAGPDSGPDSAPLPQAPNPGHSWSEIGDLPGSMWHSNNDGSGSGLDADLLDGLSSNQIQDADDYVSNAGYCTAAGSADTLDGQHGAYYRNASNLNAGTLDPGYYSAIGDLSAEGYLGNAAGDLAQNNGTVQATLNADMLDGKHASDFGGGGSCYTNWNGNTCSAGYTAVETGVWTTLVATGGGGGTICAAEKELNAEGIGTIDARTRTGGPNHWVNLEPCATCCK